MDQEPTLVHINKIMKKKTNKQINIVQSYEDTEKINNLDGN